MHHPCRYRDKTTYSSSAEGGGWYKFSSGQEMDFMFLVCFTPNLNNIQVL